MTRDDVELEAQPVAGSAAPERTSFAAIRGFLSRPDRQVAILACVSIAAVVGLAFASISQISAANSDLRLVNERYEPVKRKLAAAQAKFSTAGTEVVQAAATLQPGVDPMLALAPLTAGATESQNAWLAYKRVSLNLPGEDALEAQFDADYNATISAATQLIQGASAALTAEIQTRFSSLDHQLQVIRELYSNKISDGVRTASARTHSAERAAYIAAGAALLLMLVVFGLAMGSARRRQLEHEAREIERESHAERADLETRLQRALEMVHSEEQAYEIIEDVLRRKVDVVPAEVLVADSSRAHFHQVASTDAENHGPGCPVGEPRECPAANRGQTQIFASSADIDACPYLRSRSGPACSAVCVPMSIAGKTVGVIHTTASDHGHFDRETVMSLELVARKAGDRVGLMRAFEKSETQARTDPLTGLLNRRSLEDAVRRLPEEAPYAIAYGDLDHFKMLNDVHGHDAGDRALRVFARVLRDSVRPTDIPARYGGEEFVVVLPDCRTEAAAVEVVERVRDRLRSAQEGSPLPSFTVSFGVALSEPGAQFSEIVDTADQALLQAKADGRDRIVVSGASADSGAETVDEPGTPAEHVPAT